MFSTRGEGKVGIPMGKMLSKFTCPRTKIRARTEYGVSVLFPFHNAKSIQKGPNLISGGVWADYSIHCPCTRL